MESKDKSKPIENTTSENRVDEEKVKTDDNELDNLTEGTDNLSVVDNDDNENGINELEVAKHPLESKWTFWYNAPIKRDESWESGVKRVMDFDYVEDFWKLFNVLRTPSQLQPGSNYHVFKEGVQPKWEDSFNKAGGKWTATMPRKGDDQVHANTIDEAWLYTLLAMVGEQFEDGDEICGVVIGPRPKETKLALWTKHVENTNAVMRIGQTFKKNMNITSTIQYVAHEDALKSSYHRGASRFTL